MRKLHPESTANSILVADKSIRRIYWRGSAKNPLTLCKAS